MKEFNRKAPGARKADILAAVLPLCRARNYKTLSREQVAAAAQVSPPLVTHYWGDMAAFRLAVVEYAIEAADVDVVLQAIANKDVVPSLLSAELRAAVVRRVTM